MTVFAPPAAQTEQQTPASGNRRRVTFVLPGLGAGGSENVVSLLCNAFADRGWAVTLLAFVEPGTQPFYDPDGRIPVVALGLPPNARVGKLRGLIGRVRRLRAALRQVKPDLLISFLTRTNIVTLLARPSCPLIVSERNNAAQQRVGRVWAFLRRRLYPRSSALVTMTEGAMKQFAGFVPPVTRVIPNHASLIPPPERRPGRGRLVAVGRLVAQKGFDLLIEAWSRIADRHPDWSLTIWGEGPDRDVLEAQRDRLGLSGRVHLPGLTERPGQWTEEADVFVLSSRFEGWGLVVGEAMAAGIPTVAFDCDFGPAEMIDHGRTGLLVPPGDAAALADTLDQMLGDDALRGKLGPAGQQAMKRFTPEAVVEHWIDLAGELLGERANIVSAAGDRDAA